MFPNAHREHIWKDRPEENNTKGWQQWYDLREEWRWTFRFRPRPPPGDRATKSAAWFAPTLAVGAAVAMIWILTLLAGPEQRAIIGAVEAFSCYYWCAAYFCQAVTVELTSS